MTRDEADALAADLERAGVQLVTVEPREPAAYYPGEWQVRYWCPDPACFRQAVRDGRTELPPNALD